MNKKYSLGLDFGSLSVRNVLLDLETGNILDSVVYEYPNKVIYDILPNTNIKLGKNWALQNPNDYINGFMFTTKQLLNRNKEIFKKDIVGIGIDFTSCTVLPVDKNGKPLCNSDEFKNDPHSWVKLWKHHAAQKEADEITNLALKDKLPWINNYGGKISSEWLFPKLLQIANESPKVYKEMYRFIEATDFMIWFLTGKEKRNILTAGFKALYDEQLGFPSNDFFKKLNPLFDNVVNDKIGLNFYKPGEKAGDILPNIALELGLSPQTAVSIGLVDAHVSIASTKVIEPHNLLMIIGTSTCNILLDKKYANIKGICGILKNSILENFYTYEAGQNAVGDMFDWFVNNLVPYKYFKEAEEQKLNIHQLLTKKAKNLKIGHSGLIALDWINGNRSIVVNNNLKGLIMGLNLQTKPEEIYRCFIESTAFGQKVIIDEFERTGIKINKITMCGGLPHKNELLVQIYADILDKDIYISNELQAPAASSAMYGALAAGEKISGFKSIEEISLKLGKIKPNIVRPNLESHKKYLEIYKKFRLLHNFFGFENPIIMEGVEYVE